MVNPRSDADLLRVINTPARGIGDTTVERLTDFARGGGMSLHEALGRASEIPSLNAGAIKRLTGFSELLDKLVEIARTSSSATDSVKAMLDHSQLISALRADGSEESKTRAENLLELIGAAREFDNNREPLPPSTAEALAVEVPPLQAYLEQVALVAEADQDVGQGRVALMTLHAAKGLEFDVVFLTGMELGVFPHERALRSYDPEEKAEERRLCYVGITRARRRLYLSLAKRRLLYGELRENPPSPFLTEVPRELFAFDAPAIEGRQAFAPTVRKPSWRDENDQALGPRVDRSYSQATELDAQEGDVRGMKVRHQVWGVGVVAAVDGMGADAKLTVRFPDGTVKKIIARYLSPA
jgi:DNA helicase-2/ATP-dependent DNA helicase PcrA